MGNFVRGLWAQVRYPLGFSLEGRKCEDTVIVLGTGTPIYPEVSSIDGAHFLDFNLKSLSAGSTDVYGVHILLNAAGTAPGYAINVHGKISAGIKSEVAGLYAHAQLSGGQATGQFYAAIMEMIVDTGISNMPSGGVLQLVSWANGVLNAVSGFITLRDYGTNKMNNLFNFIDLSATPGADITIFSTKGLKIRIASSTFYIPVADSTGAVSLPGALTLTSLGFTGSSAAAIDLSGITPQIGNGKFLLGIGKRGTAKSVSLTTGRYEPIQLVVTSHANPTGTQTMNLIYANIDTDIAQASARLKVADWNIVAKHNVQDAYVYQGEIDFITNSVVVGGEAAVLGLVMNADSAVTGNLRGIIISMQGTGMHATAIGIELRTTCGTGLGAGLAEGIRISGTPLPIVGIAMGNQANNNEGPQFAFFFPSPPGADIGPCVNTVDDGNGEGSIAIKIGADTKYLKYWANPAA